MFSFLAEIQLVQTLTHSTDELLTVPIVSSLWVFHGYLDLAGNTWICLTGSTWIPVLCSPAAGWLLICVLISGWDHLQRSPAHHQSNKAQTSDVKVEFCFSYLYWCTLVTEMAFFSILGRFLLWWILYPQSKHVNDIFNVDVSQCIWYYFHSFSELEALTVSKKNLSK